MDNQQGVRLLDGGSAHYIGDGVFMLMQKDESKAVHSVVVTRADLERILTAC